MVLSKAYGQKGQGEHVQIPVGRLFAQMPLTKRHWQAGFGLFFTFVIEAWELMVIVYVAGMIGQDFGLNQVQIGSLMGVIFLGMIPGCLLWGLLVDRLGRKRTVMWSLILYGILSGISAFSVNYAMLMATRFLSGLAISGCFITVFPYFEELLPVKQRGRATVYLASGWPIGTLLAVAVSYLGMKLDWSWHAILFVSSLAALWFLVVWRYVPESPYWLVAKGKQEEAKTVLADLSAGRMAVEDGVTLVVEGKQTGNYLSIFRRNVRNTTLLQTLINFCYSWGYWALFMWMPYMLAESKGIAFVNSLGFVVVSALFQFPGYIASSSLTGRFGRKKVMIAFVLGAAVGTFGFAASDTTAVLLAWLAMLSFFNLGGWGVWDTWMGELYPTETRTAAYSWGAMSQRVANWLAPSVIGAFLASNQSFLVTNAFIALFLVVTAVAALFLRETEGDILH